MADNKKDPKKEAAFIAEMNAINEAMEIGRQTSEFNWKLTDGWIKKRNLEPLPFEKDPEGKTILGRLKESVTHLSKLNDRYNKLRKEVNAYFGKEVLKGHRPLLTFEEIMRKLRDGGDEGIEG
jgi:hypothetical protein